MSESTGMSRERSAAPEAWATLETWSRSLDLRGLQAEYGTPLYIMDSETLRANFARYLELVDRPECIRYPVKANPSAAILEIIAGLGGGADCAAPDEIWAALGAGIPVTRISYNSPAAEPKLAVWLLRTGGTVVADSIEALNDLQKHLRKPTFAGRLFVRVNPGGLPGYRDAAEIHRYTAHGGENSAFGIPSEVLPEVLTDYPLPVTGLHMHVGTQMDNLEAFTAATDFLNRMSRLLESHTGHDISTLNLGGGLGIPFLDGQQFPSIEALADALLPLRREGITYEVEPGNSLVGNAVALLAQVAAVKTMRGRRWGILDVGTDQLMKFTIARWEHQIVDAEHEPFPRDGTDALGGPLCFAGDVLLPATRLAGVERGDPVLIRHAGAYCEAVSSHFNGRRGPAHIVIETDGSVRLTRREEDTFFEPNVQGHLPAGLENGGEEGELIGAGAVEALQSQYLQHDSVADGYTILEARRVGERAYRFEVEPRASVDFMGWPLAMRIASDAVIIAVGHMLGWRTKAGPMWGTRLSLTYDSMLHVREPLPCRVVVSPLRRLPRRAPGYTGTARFELGAGEIAGVVQVLVPVKRVAQTGAS